MKGEWKGKARRIKRQKIEKGKEKEDMGEIRRRGKWQNVEKRKT